MKASVAPSAPSAQTATDSAIRHLADAVLRLRAAGEELAALDLDAASAALVLGLLEQGGRSVAYGQLRTAFAADANQVHRLDPETACLIDALAADPRALAEGTAPVPQERMCPGMSPHRSTASFLQAHLHISSAEARRRLTGGRLLVAPAPSHAGAEPPEPVFPVLGRAAADGSADVGALAQLAAKLESLQPRIGARPDAANLVAAIEEDLAREVRTREPKDSHKALSDWVAYLAENGAPITDEEILARRGLFFRGYRDGCDEYLLRCDPLDSETILAFAEAFSNPRSEKLPQTSVSTGAKAPAAHDAPEPTGIPAPEWAVAPGTDPGQVPLSTWVCGPPAAAVSYGTNGTNGTNGTHGTNGTPVISPDGTGGTSAWWEARDPRTTPQLLLDGVIAAITGALDGTAIGQYGGLPVRVGVLIDYRSLVGACEDAGITAHGRPISAANCRRLACDGGILPAVLGSSGEMLDMGREVRVFTPAQRKALAIRDRGCVIPGCRRAASTSEAHHVKPWSEGGQTNVDSGCMLCQHHHLMVHAGLITLKMISGIPYVTARKGQPRGDPERNLYWHPELRTAGYTPPLFID